MGGAAVRIALNRLRTGERLKRPESDFPLIGDGHSIGIPHARIDPAPKWQRRGVLAGEFGLTQENYAGYKLETELSV